MSGAFIRQIWRYPVKSMGGERLASTDLGRGGIRFDRGWAVRDSASGAVRTAKHFPQLMHCAARVEGVSAAGAAMARVTLPDGTRFASDDTRLAAALSSLVGADVMLVRAPDAAGVFDDAPVNLLTEASLHYLGGALPGAGVDVRRFRPNFLVADAGAPAGPVEFDWVGREVRLGAAQAAITARCPRCIMTTRSLSWEGPALREDPEILKTLARLTARDLAVYGEVRLPGPVREGDPVTVVG